MLTYKNIDNFRTYKPSTKIDNTERITKTIRKNEKTKNLQLYSYTAKNIKN